MPTATPESMTLAAYNKTCDPDRYAIDDFSLSEWYDMHPDALRKLERIDPPRELRQFHAVRLQYYRDSVNYVESRGSSLFGLAFVLVEGTARNEAAVSELPWEVRSEIKRCW